MAVRFIPHEELARRLCVVNHRADFNTGGYRQTTVPCAAHLREAENYWNLTRPEGARSLRVVWRTMLDNRSGAEAAWEPYSRDVNEETDDRGSADPGVGGLDTAVGRLSEVGDGTGHPDGSSTDAEGRPFPPVHQT